MEMLWLLSSLGKHSITGTVLYYNQLINNLKNGEQNWVSAEIRGHV